MKFAILTRDGQVRSTIEDAPDGTFRCSDSGIAFEARHFQKQLSESGELPPSAKVVPYMYETMKRQGHRVKILDEGETDV